MKKNINYWRFLLVLMLFGGIGVATAQTPGVPYQAYIIDTNAGYIPGDQLEVPLTNADVLLQFEFRNSKGIVEYIEQIQAKTDEYGMVSTVVGTGSEGSTAILGTFNDIVWDGLPKDMYIDIDFSNSGSNFVDHGKMMLVYVPGPADADVERTITTLTDNGDGSYTYTSEDGTKTSFSVPQHDKGDPNALGAAGNVGDLFVDENTGNLYMHGGTSWLSLNGGVTTGIGEPTATDPSNPAGGDIYVDESTGDIYTYNSTTSTWENQSDVVSADADNLIVEGTDGLAYLSAAELGLVTGTGAPTATSPDPATLAAGDIYVDESTGDIYTYDGTEWIAQPGVSATTGTGVPTATDPADPEGGDIYVDESTGDIYTYNSTTSTWENQSTTLANNGLTVNADNTVQLGGDLIQPTTITTDATNTLALNGLQDAPTTDYDIIVVDNTTGVVQKTAVTALPITRYMTSYTAADGDIDFATPQTILDLGKIDVYRNGVRIDFTQVDTNTIKLDLGVLTGCYAGDEIRIVQLQ